MNIDFGQKLEIKIDNRKPVQLVDLTISLLGISQQYQRLIESETTQDYAASTELYIKEVRTGSIIVELVALTMPIIPLAWQGGPLSEWVDRAKDILEWLQGKTTTPPTKLSKQDLKQWNSILEPIAKDHASQLNLCVHDGNVVINNYTITSQEANAAQNGIQHQIERLDEPSEHVHKNKVMHWYQTKFDAGSDTGDKATIEHISPKPLKVIFENNAVKEAMLAGDSRFSKPWHKLAYVVDVQVQTVNGVPKMYTILRYHEEHTFDPTE